MKYQLLCPCGRTLAGERLARHQVLPCSGCGRAVFVLPGPFQSTEPAKHQRRRRWWLAPLLAGLGLLLVLGGLFAYLAPYLGRDSEKKADAPPEIESRIQTGRDHLGQGKFYLAREQFDEALVLRERYPGALSEEASRELNQLHRQADLLARLLPVSVEEVVRQAKLVRDPREWAMQFTNYRSKTVLFDDRVRRDQLGRPKLADHVLEVGGEVVRLALEDLEVLRDLPLDDGPRVIFGGRLDSCVREEDGWVVRFARDSGVLMTDLDALSACLPGPADAATKEVLARQKKWLGERAAVTPARR